MTKLVSCPACGRGVGDNAIKCPHCGSRTRWGDTNVYGCLILAIAVPLLFLLLLYSL